jgi:hypothetical protein
LGMFRRNSGVGHDNAWQGLSHRRHLLRDRLAYRSG